MGWTRFVTRRPGLVLSALLLLTAGIGHRALFIVQDNSPETFYAVDREAQAVYRELVDTFGSDEIVLVELRGAKLDSAEDLLAVARLQRAVGQIDGVRAAGSVADIFVDPDAEEIVAPSEGEVEAVVAEVEAVPMYRQMGFARPSIPSLGVVVPVVVEGPDARPRLIEALEEAAASVDRPGVTARVIGITAAHAEIDRETRRTMTFFLPLVVVLVGVMGLVIFRSPKAVLAMLLPVGGAVIVGAGALELSGSTMNLVSGVMPPLVEAIGFAGAIHLVSHYAAAVTAGLSPEEAVQKTLRDKVVPTTFAFVTTAVGFGSLVVSEVSSVRTLGAISAIALLAATLLVTLGTPALLLVLKPRLTIPEHRHRLLQRLAARALRRRWFVIGAAAILLVPVALGLPRLSTSVDGMEMLSDGSQTKQAFRQLEDEGVGLYPIDLWVRRPSPDYQALLEDARRVDRLVTTLAEPWPGVKVTAVAGVHDVLRLIQYRTTGLAELPEYLDDWELLEDAERATIDKSLAPFWARDKGVRISVMTTTAELDDVQAFVAHLRQAVAKEFGPDAPLAVSGHYMMLIGTPGKLMNTLVESLALTVGAITLLFLLAFRSVTLVFSGMLANLLPVFVVIGVMGWLGIAADVATVMVGSVAFGLAVDDTFHYLYHRKKTGSILEAAGIAGQGIVATTFMIAAGLGVLGLSGFNPVVRFGLLAALAVLVALLVDGVLLPALVGERSVAVDREPSS